MALIYLALEQAIEILEGMAAEARRIAPSLAWPAVAARYGAHGEELLARRLAVPA